VSIRAPVTIGTLIVDNAESPYRNRIRDRDTGNTLTFKSDSGPAHLQIDGTGASFVEFQVEAGVVLDSDLLVTVNHVDGDSEYGALRLREQWSGSGGLRKAGAGIMSLTGAGKNFSGPTIIEQGVLRVTEPAVPVNTSGVAVLPGGQLRLVSGGEGVRIYSFGGSISLNSEGRGGDIPAGDEQGILGGLRYDPGSNDNAILLTNDILLAGPSAIHVDGARNAMTLSGRLTGAGSLTKSGGGLLALSGDSYQYTGTVALNTGGMRVDGTLAADVSLVPGTWLDGSGVVARLSGFGTIAPNRTVLTAESVSGLHYAFVFSETGSPNYGAPAASENAVLRLTSATPFLQPLNAANRVDFFLNRSELNPGDFFRGGFFTHSSFDLQSAVAGAAIRVFIADENGTVELGGQTYSLYAGTEPISVRAVSETADFGGGPVAGRVLQVAVGVEPYTVTAAAAPAHAGSVTGAGLYGGGATAELNAIASDFFTFSHWSGDVPSGGEADNPLLLLVDAEKEVTAHFAEEVTQNTGTPHWWLASFGLTEPSFEAAAEMDHDGDGMAAWQEYIVGTDPTDPQSRFRVGNLSLDGDLEVRFHSLASRIYTLQSSANLIDWTDVPGQGPRPGVDGEDLFSAPVPSARGFLRVKVQLP
jgi:autotransporter-associated beta strand protein